MDLQTEEEVDILRSEVKTFQKIDNEIENIKNQMKPLQLKLKDLRNQKKELQEEICLTLSKNNMNLVELQDTGYKVEFVQKQAVVPINQKSIKEKIMDFFERGQGSKMSFNSLSGTQKATNLIDYLYSKENRQYIQKDVLKPVD
jgi:predicted  nucleic acid-binding Zn-ribbon protein